MKLLQNIGKYTLMLTMVFTKPKKWKIFLSRLINELENIGISSLPIVALMSTFIGGVIALQTASSMSNPLLPKYTVGYITQSSTILEFSPTIISLILAGKVGSNIASEIGTMRVTEQIDALEVMGVNPATHLVRPKIFALVFFNPLLIVLSMFAGIIGGLLAGTLSGECTVAEFVSGIQYDFIPFKAVYAIIKTVLFAFVIASVSSFHGFYTDGGALEVGKSSTKAVVYSSVVIIVLNYILTQLLLN